jgi:hypothetical protein
VSASYEDVSASAAGYRADRDRLDARVREAEKERDEALHAEEVAERYREAAEARVKELEEEAEGWESEVERLRANDEVQARLLWKAEAENAKLREALERIRDRKTEFIGGVPVTAQEIARAALSDVERPDA